MELSPLLEEGVKKTTPFYYYDVNLLDETLKTIKNESSKYNFKIHYAVKANINPKIMKLISDFGFGADCVSGNELDYAISMGFKNKNIVLAGVGKTDREIRLALERDIFCMNVESIEELEIINEIAKNMGKIAPIALRLNPNINAKTHHYITTGLTENKFGISSSILNEVLDITQNLTNILLKGIHFHIGSQILDLNVYRKLCYKVNEILNELKKRKISIDHVNVGGGLGIDYKDPDQNPICNFAEFFGLFHEILKLESNQNLHFEIGRSIVGTCGSLISKVIYVKKGIETDFVIIDAGMTELIRPALYHSYHPIINISSSENKKQYDIVGPICESSDCFGKKFYLPLTKRGDIIAIRCAGAYGQVMSSRYNLRNEVPSLYSDGTWEYKK